MRGRTPSARLGRWTPSPDEEERLCSPSHVIAAQTDHSRVFFFAQQVDPRTGIFTADTRYNGVTDDGADLYFQTSGPQTPSRDLHLRIKIETGDERYYFLNNVVGASDLP